MSEAAFELVKTTVHQFAGQNGRIEERAGFLELTGRLAHHSLAERWRTASKTRRGLPACLEVTRTRRASGGIEFDWDVYPPGQADLVEAELTITLRKLNESGELIFITAEGLISSLKAQPEQFERSNVVRCLEVIPSFCTIGTIFGGIDASAALPIPFAEPRRIVWEQGSRTIVPERITTWLPESDVSGDEPVYKAFRKQAAHRLAFTLADRIEDRDGMRLVELRPDRRLEIASDDALTLAKPENFRNLVAAARWVYESPQDAEARHRLLTSELIRSWPGNTTWEKGLSDLTASALESARIAYSLHLETRGVDALNLMSDLLRAIADDTRAITAQSSAVATALWRDTALAATAVVLKGLTTAIDDWVVWAVLIYLTFSAFINLNISSRTVTDILENRRAFKDKLYHFLGEIEYEKLAGKSYSKTERNFRFVQFSVILFYAIVAASLLALLFDLLPWLPSDELSSKVIFSIYK